MKFVYSPFIGFIRLRGPRFLGGARAEVTDLFPRRERVLLYSPDFPDLGNSVVRLSHLYFRRKTSKWYISPRYHLDDCLSGRCGEQRTHVWEYITGLIRIPRVI